MKVARDHLASLTADRSARRGDDSMSNEVQHESSTTVGRDEANGIATDYDYRVVPFIGQSKGRLSANDVAKQLEAVIAQHAHAGWEFCQLSDVNIEVQPGCVAGIFGASTQYARFDQLIFRKRR